MVTNLPFIWKKRKCIFRQASLIGRKISYLLMLDYFHIRLIWTSSQKCITSFWQYKQENDNMYRPFVWLKVERVLYLYVWFEFSRLCVRRRTLSTMQWVNHWLIAWCILSVRCTLFIIKQIDRMKTQWINGTAWYLIDT
jgi:hypothetical protein